MAVRRHAKKHPLLTASGLNAWYGAAQILFDLGFTVFEGEVVALMGRNGAGKSTTVKSLMGLVRHSGEIRFDERLLLNMKPHAIARLGLGYVPEERRVFKGLSVAENLEVGRLPLREGAAAWTPERLFDLFPNLAEARHRQASDTSGGEQQMLAIARTLMGNPKLLLLDEPSEGLAPVIVERMAKTLKTLKAEGLTILMCEQNIHFARPLADRALVLESGVVRYDGSFEALEADDILRRGSLAL